MRRTDRLRPLSPLPFASPPAGPLDAELLRQAWPSLAALVGANLVPLLGVLFAQWDLGLVLLLYWVESAVILAFNLLKLLRLGWAGVAMAVFFCFHAGLFMLVHLVFLLTLFHALDGRSLGDLAGTLLLPVGSLVLSHGISFVNNTLRRGEAPRNPQAVMAGFYSRIVVMQLTIIFGAFLMALLGSPIWALVLLVLLKTGVDVASHLRERRRDRPAAFPNAPAAAPALS